jgi:hypothetical protein
MRFWNAFGRPSALSMLGLHKASIAGQRKNGTM